MHLFYTPSIPKTSAPFFYTLNEEESKHCIKVLRLSEGDKITLIDGTGGWYQATITDANAKQCTVEITEKKNEYNKHPYYLHIAIAPTKNMDRLEWFIEKATETGIDEISLINCKNSERTVVKHDRVEKVAVSAIKQSLKAYLPSIHETSDFKKFITSVAGFEGQKLIAHCRDGEAKIHLKTILPKGEAAIILIGPEGDFTSDEIKMAIDSGFKEISLGESRLRTETAALYSCMAVNIINA